MTVGSKTGAEIALISCWFSLPSCLFAFALLEEGKVPFLFFFLSLFLLVAIRKASFCSKELLEEWD